MSEEPTDCPLCGQEVPMENLAEHIQKFDAGMWTDFQTGRLWVREDNGEWHGRILPPRALKHARETCGDERQSKYIKTKDRV